MKRLIAAGVIAAAAVATVAGCSVSASSPLAFNAESCSEFTTAIGASVSGAHLESGSLDDTKGSCTWSADGGTITLTTTGSQNLDVQIGTKTVRQKVEKDAGQRILANDKLKGDDGVLYTPKAVSDGSTRTFVGDDGSGKVTLDIDGIDVTDKQVSRTFTALFSG